MSTVEDRLAKAGIKLPPAAAPVANYVPFVRTGNLVIVSGQICLGPTARLPPRTRASSARRWRKRAGARGGGGGGACAINVLAQLKAAIGDLDKVVRVVRLGGFINSTPDYGAVPQVMNGASDLMVEISRRCRTSCRSTIGVAQLPLMRRRGRGHVRNRMNTPNAPAWLTSRLDRPSVVCYVPGCGRDETALAAPAPRLRAALRSCDVQEAGMARRSSSMITRSNAAGGLEGGVSRRSKAQEIAGLFACAAPPAGKPARACPDFLALLAGRGALGSRD